MIKLNQQKLKLISEMMGSNQEEVEKLKDPPTVTARADQGIKVDGNKPS